MKRKLIGKLSSFEIALWMVSAVLVTLSFMWQAEKDMLTLVASLIGVTALIFVAKGYVIGQILTVVFAVFYGIISFYFKYYGEMITYLCMSSPIAVAAVVSWMKNPFENSAEVKVKRLTKKRALIIGASGAVITVIFYFILRALGNASLVLSTVSVFTSYVASALTLVRSRYYGLAYAANDVVLIGLWIAATVQDRAYLPMVICFTVFFANDVYGFYHWSKMEKRQEKRQK